MKVYNLPSVVEALWWCWGANADHVYLPPPSAVNTNNKLQQGFIDALCCYFCIFGLFGRLWNVRA
jgi:hypothetical protein